MRYRRYSGPQSKPARSPTCSPSRPASAHTSTLTTPNGMCRWTTAARPVKPGSATSARWPVPATGQQPTAAGKSTSPNPATSYTAHPPDTWYLIAVDWCYLGGIEQRLDAYLTSAAGEE